MISSINRIADWVENILVTALMLIATVTAIVQVAARYVFNNSLYWSEELILYSLITMSFLTMGMGVRYAAHISVDAGLAFVGPKAARAMHVIAALMGVGFAVILIYYGYRLSQNTLRMGQLSPAMRIPVGYVYLIIPISGLLMALRYCLVLSELGAGRDYEPPKSEIKNA
ncbi:TRAP transporter small permease [Aerobium aerolatum]|uniref:TRAP transporter small permease protein n=1 Tax=Aquamicrobium aerolatum DSM 21857 TaxID=1121003 RepID=A0A1I3QR14_9HYPH|nr:TRAP transporter small permease [Aquamicrobium aerolatum]SFJ35721.1 Tripartite ATP-independent transporter, DctQ component [Aquamicrobium aerolatum DSM 21857]